MATKASVIGLITPGAQVVVRDEEWLVRSVADTKSDGRMVRTVGISELVRDEEATFFTSIDDVEPVGVAVGGFLECRCEFAAPDELVGPFGRTSQGVGSCRVGRRRSWAPQREHARQLRAPLLVGLERR
jgi:hypothetical protein